MDRSRLVLRRKQLDLGYNTIGYARYVQLVPRGRRSTNLRRHPRTPDPLRDCSKRSFDGQIRRWRRLLHQYDNICSDEKGVEEITALQAESRPLYAGSLSTELSTFPHQLLVTEKTARRSYYATSCMYNVSEANSNKLTYCLILGNSLAVARKTQKFTNQSCVTLV
ncbi:uncharacterized protein MICPUCDRAFT_55661 [Micromonas pusilla CCMP1545]|uniref:Histone RNA hairpin-binding protein RNA-binding domain-containing protein n=1 Tax=Micromonas pusilla (strain CCMP1545) TaxID=564608 RepID=C1MLB9_MICPC|nr:uncharacterized protein MICPUCDRAFT_55661 [Micromonas pusilla CCMP1545]EEH59912.1 hypothetical protein MICPUCDRAFT_55661 [Micromonas pusilla CCMP1545]|eukprot:XP_003056536.1 hypothetical protein MICPUCDRAFT_55661 [Micromonas pusilla CCMP1545]